MTEDIAKTFVRECGLPGLVVSVFDLQRIDTFACGLRDVESGLPLNADDVFPLASVTKTFTADLVLRAAADGQLDMDASIASQFPGFALADPEASAHMTPRDALCHFSGLPPHTWAWVFGDTPRMEFIRERLPHLAACGPFREQHRYSNLLYAVLGGLLECATGCSWEELLTNRILGPLGLRDTRLLDETWMRAGVCPHKRHGDRALRIPPFLAKTGHLIAPASELAASVPDLARWGQAQLALAADDSRWRPHNLVSDGIAYGLGWRIDLQDGPRRVWHSGQCSGFSTLLSLQPDLGRGIALATNVSTVIPELQALARGLPPPLRLPPPTVSRPPAFSHRLPATGSYGHPGYGSLQIEFRDGHPWTRFQNAAATPLQADESGWHIVLPTYDVSFPIIVTSPDEICIPFEALCPGVVFRRK